MRPIKEQQQEAARELFFQSDLTRSQIAEQVGVSEKTIYLWTKAGDWRKLKSASRLMPSLIVEHFYSQIQELNENIRNREPGHRFPTVQEAEVFRKLVLTAERLKKKQTRGEYSEMFQKFMQWLLPQNERHLKLFTDYANAFLTQSAIHGFHPYDIEYGIEEPEPEIPPASLREASQASEHSATKQSRQTTEQTDEQQEITGNNSFQSYDLEINNLHENATEQQEITLEPQTGNNRVGEKITPEQETGNNTETPSLFLGKVLEGRKGNAAEDKNVEVGYLGQKQDIDPNNIKTIEYKPDDSIQKFSIGDAVYYIKKKE